MNNRTEAKLTNLSGMQKGIDEILKQAWERGRKYGQNEARPQGEWHPVSEVLPKIGDEVIVHGCKGIIVREPYQIGSHDDPLHLVVVWYGRFMGDAKLRDIQPTGKKYPAIVKIMEKLKG